MADDRYVQDLIKELRENPDWDIRSSAAQTLGDIVFEENQARVVVNALTAALNDSNDNVRIWTVVALGDLAERNIDISSALPAIEKALDDEEEDVIYNAVEFFKAYDLAKLPLRNRFNIKLKISGSEEAIEDIISIGKPAIPALIDALKDGNRDVRWLAAEALEKIGLDKVSIEDKVLALLVLEKTDAIEIEEPVIHYLADVLTDEDMDIRMQASKGLGEIAEKIADKGDYISAFNIIKNATARIRKFYEGKTYKISPFGFVERLIIMRAFAEPFEKIAEKIADKGDYASVLIILKDSTVVLMLGRKDRHLLRQRRELLGKFAEIAAKIHDKMNPLDKKEPMKWQKPIAERPAKKVNKRVLAK